MNITPNGTVQLYKNISLDPSYSKTFFFQNENEQYAFFSGDPNVVGSVSPVLTVNNVTYQRERKNTIRIETTTEPVFNCNYMRFRNRDAVGNTFPNKWYYAFILNLEYVNNNTVEILYQIDVMQTWLPKYGSYANDYELGSCLVLRNHSTTDAIGDNLQPENFGVGEAIPANSDYYTMEIAKEVDSQQGVTFYNDEWYVVIAIENQWITALIDTISAKLTSSDRMLAYSTAFSGIYQGIGFLAYPINSHTIGEIDLFIISSEISSLSGVIDVFMCPSFCLPTVKPIKAKDETDEAYEARVEAAYYDNLRNKNTTTLVKNLNVEYDYISSPTSFDGYEPINNKLFTYPYNFIYVTNNRGQSNTYRYELFTNAHGTFKAEGGFGMQASMMLYPTNYKNQSALYEEKIMIDSFPSCSFASPQLVDWLAKTAMVAGSAAGAAISGVIKSKDGSDKKKNKANTNNAVDPNVPNNTEESTENKQSKNEKKWYNFLSEIPAIHVPFATANPDILMGNHYTQTYTMYQMQILKEFAIKIDDYFSRFGYPINDVKVPNINARPKFTYIETENCCMRNNNIPASVEKQICEIYNNGITFWKDKTQVDNYGRSLYLANKIGGSG